MAFEMNDTRYEMNLVYDEDTDEHVVTYLMDGEVVNVGRSDWIPKAVRRLADQMGKDVDEVLSPK